MNLCALTIAASDPSGGAGVEMDLKVFTAQRVFGLSAITAFTVQTTRGLKEVHPNSIRVFERILDELAGDIPLQAIKIGVVATARHAEAIALFLERMPGVPVVLDPVMAASSGQSLIEPGTEDAIRELLLPRSSLITPNLAEASVLAGIRVRTTEDMIRAAEILCETGVRAVLVKGGHLADEAADIFSYQGKTEEWSLPRIPGEFHGTGCALSACIAARLARGEGIESAVKNARAYLHGLLNSAFPGKGRARIIFPDFS